MSEPVTTPITETETQPPPRKKIVQPRTEAQLAALEKARIAKKAKREARAEAERVAAQEPEEVEEEPAPEPAEEEAEEEPAEEEPAEPEAEPVPKKTRTTKKIRSNIRFVAR